MRGDSTDEDHGEDWTGEARRWDDLARRGGVDEVGRWDGTMGRWNDGEWNDGTLLRCCGVFFLNASGSARMSSKPSSKKERKKERKMVMILVI